MSRTRPVEVEPGLSLPGRVLGRIRGDGPGPTLICVGGLHGNEPAGVLGLLRVLGSLDPQGTALSGEFLALAGNLSALALGRRFVDVDLNRAWTAERMRLLRNGGPPRRLPEAEAQEQVHLLKELDSAAARARGPVFALDLHTTSGPGGCFVTVGDTLRNRAFAMGFPAPLILGLEELVEGTLVEHLERRGYVCAAFESGQHDDPRAVDLAEAAIWIGLAGAGVLLENRHPRVTRARRLMAAESRGLPRVLEMRYRHPVEPRDAFVMDPGWSNFESVEEGEPVARDRSGPVPAPHSGRLLMPLYQTQGEDGFFVIREFHAFWLRLSALLRRTRLDRIVHWLPGIRRDLSRIEGQALVVDRRVARWYALELLHLLGYRKHQEAGEELVVLRRPFDVAPSGRTLGGRPDPERDDRSE